MSDIDQLVEAYMPALELERLMSRPLHRTLLLSSAAVSALSGGLYLGGTLIPVPPEPLYGLCLLASGTYFTLLLLRLFHNSFYFRGFHAIATTDVTRRGMTYEVARVLHYGREAVTTEFMRRPQGYSLVRHLGFSDTEVSTLLYSLPPLARIGLLLKTEGFITFTDLALAIKTYDQAFATALKEKGVTDEMYTETIGWVTRTYYRYKHDQRWWGRDALKSLPSIGKAWSYGFTYHLERYAKSLSQNSLFDQLIDDNDYASDRIKTIEEVLCRNREANVLLVAEAGVGAMDIIRKITERSERGLTHELLRGKRFVTLDTERLLIEFTERAALEGALHKLFTEAEAAGNLVVIIPELGRFVRATESLGSDIAVVLESYLNSADLHIIATTDPQLYHLELEKLPMMTRLEVVHITPPTLLGTERLLENQARSYEQQYKVVLTYPAIHTITDAADRFIMTGVMPDKAVDLMGEVLGAAANASVDTVTDTFVETYVSKKTGIPMGPIDATERDTLLDLEGRLHERVIGQDHAIVAISSTLRRARAGIQSTKRPLGSFLFLGPTGVGKTETAKALATVFFGDEKNMQRLDMSEFSAEESLERLIGTPETPGILANTLSEHPYCVLLLDEFEKGHKSIHDLFLQILDEGAFTDARGSKINLRNTIIIATSNAGSTHILAAIEAATPLDTVKDEIVSAIIRDGIYRPELVNRFDGVILFEPLGESEQTAVADLMLQELTARLLDKGYRITFDTGVLELIAKEGFSREFGARPMRRVIQEHIEEAVARKIISGSLQKGSSLTITPQDISFA